VAEFIAIAKAVGADPVELLRSGFVTAVKPALTAAGARYLHVEAPIGFTKEIGDLDASSS
jgi:hypothetical protein